MIRSKIVFTIVSAAVMVLVLTYLELGLPLSKLFSDMNCSRAEMKSTQYSAHRDEVNVSIVNQRSLEIFAEDKLSHRRLCDPFHSRVNLLNRTFQSKTKRNYRIVEPPLNSAVSRACAGMFDRTRVLWITGPPGSGKTTLAKRFQEYGFMAMDCEDPWADKGNRTKNLITASQFVLENGTTTYIFAACFVKILWSKPPNVDIAVLFPNSNVYRRRWMARNPDDLQNPSKQWRLTSNLVKTFKKDSSVHVIHQSSSAECIDQTLFKICSQVLGKEVSS